MWKYVKFVLGLFLILCSVAGAFSFFSGQAEQAGMRIVENGVDVKGIVEKREQVTVAARWGRVGGMGRYYTMTYSFQTLEGAKYGGELNVSKEQAYSVNDGDEITVRYYAKQPSINSPLGFKEYMTAEDARDLPWGAIVFALVLFAGGGGWLVWSNWRRIRPEIAGLTAGVGSGSGTPVIPQSRVNTVARKPGGPMFGGS